MQYDYQAGWWRRSQPRAEEQAGSDVIWRDYDQRDGMMPFLALMGFITILLLAPQQIFPVLAPLRIAALSILLALILHVSKRLRDRKTVFRMDAGTKFALMLLLWACVTIPLSFWPGGSLTFLTAIFFKSLVLLILLANIVDSTWKLRWLSWSLLVMVIPLALTTIRNFAGGVLTSDGTRALGYDSPLATNPNDMALLLNLILPFAIASFLSSRGVLWRSITAVIIAVMVGGIIATFSRAGFLMLASIFIMYIIALRRRKEKMLAPFFLILVLVAIPFLPEQYLGRLGTITDVESDTTGSAQIRMRDMSVAMNLATDRPLTGFGIGMNTLVMNEARGATWTEIHNVYLALIVELGVPGLLLFLLLFGACIRGVMKVVKETAGSKRHEELNGLATAVLVSLLAFSLAAFFYPVAYHFFFYFMAGLALALSEIWRREQAGEIDRDAP